MRQNSEDVIAFGIFLMLSVLVILQVDVAVSWELELNRISFEQIVSVFPCSGRAL